MNTTIENYKYVTRYKKHSGCLVVLSYGYKPQIWHYFSNKKKLNLALKELKQKVDLNQCQILETKPHIVVKLPNNDWGLGLATTVWLAEKCPITKSVKLNPSADIFPQEYSSY